ncbi:hypothetical protein OGAPHI_000828 [Ogataea philodendri]|uniref:Protein LAS1 n=1 Tax=Ogataea philodendri TaxID=1378263 RepID=A0A9P8PFJ7_9ASCO|nr:uncharacterized protein OGAPHI_000828 [Ogataea philodendri]KAH3671117.1 hypothetical protein OGAPHI_000828 [Ogataea philodendri]
MSRHPQITPYKSSEDFQQLKQWFYSPDPSLRERAVQKVTAYSTKGNLPHSMEATMLLTSSCLLDERLTSMRSDLTPVKLSFTMSLIKFCNGLLDPIQKSTYAISLNRLAEILQLPTYFVEIRHAGTHETLPSLEMLRFGAQNALEWLEINYWNEVLQSTTTTPPVDETETETTGLAESFKTLRKIRKEDIYKVYKFGDSTETGTKYWKSMKVLKNAKQDVLVKFLVFQNTLILKTELTEKKVNGIRFLYKPILEELGYDLILELFNVLLSVESQEEIFQAQRVQWLEYFLSNQLTFSQNSIYSKFLNTQSVGVIFSLLTKTPADYTPKLLKVLLQHRQLLDQTFLTNKVLEQIEFITSFNLPDLPLQPERKKQKIAQIYLFQPHETWEPTPFGQL